jgi:transcriptional regulator with XRE-family HTH domain
MSGKLEKYKARLESLSFDDKYNVVRLLVKDIVAEAVIVNGQRISQFEITYQLVKLEIDTDVRVNSKFDLRTKKSLHIIYTENYGTKLRNLRLISGMTAKELSSKINICDKTLRDVERNKISKPFYYWKLICDYFKIDHIDYLELDTMGENTIKEKLEKIRAFIGAKSWEEVGIYLGYSEGFILDLLTRYTPNEFMKGKINSALDKLR